MVDMKKLADLLRKLEDQLVVCMRCGMCQAVCPVFAETGREPDVARGKLALLDGLLQEMFKDPKGVSERLSRCLLCGSCAANCPSGVKVLDIFLSARAILAGYTGLHPAKKIIFRGMLARPELFDRLLEWGSRLQGVFLEPVDEFLGTSCTRFPSPLAGRRLMALAPEPFHKRVPALSTPVGSSGVRVAFFVGCLVDKIFPETGRAVVQSLEHHGVGIFLPEGLGCCGIPALASGDSESFQRLVRHNLERLAAEPFDHLVTACATCTSTIKKVWPPMTGGLSQPQADRLRRLADQAMDISQFLVDRVGVSGALRPEGVRKQKWTYHDPCHLKKVLGVALQPRTLLRASPEVELVEMLEADRCCGCGGSFNLQHYDLSTAIGRRKRANIVRSGCTAVATSCPACMLQLSDMLSQAGDRIAVRHVVEVYAEAVKR